jgi:hypothetical protein
MSMVSSWMMHCFVTVVGVTFLSATMSLPMSWTSIVGRSCRRSKQQN